MARKKSPLKAKEPIRLRFKTLSNGNKSVYLDIYRDGQREYEFLKLYIIPEITPLDKIQNEQTMQAANAIKSQRILELTNNEAGIKQINKGKMFLSDWLQKYHDLQHAKSRELRLRIIKTAELLMQYAGGEIRLKDVDKDFCAGFADWLQNDYLPIKGNTTYIKACDQQTKNNRPDPKRIKKVTAHNYFVMLKCALAEAVRQGIIDNNPCGLMNQTDKIKVPESQRTYLTIDEVRKLIETDFPPHPEVKQSFLFSCFCGLRLSDVLRLEWKDVITDGAQTRLAIVMKKTKAPLYLPLSKQALNYLPARNGAPDTAKVFDYPQHILQQNIKKWIAKAGINKQVSFHTARHTFATTLLTEGADLYTVSKLLGHSDIATTQIYAKIIDKKKDEAVNLLDNIF